MQKLSVSSVVEASELIQRIANRHHTSIDVDSEVRDILKSVQAQGDEFLKIKTRQFDSPNFDRDFRVNMTEMQTAAASISYEDMEIIRQAAANIRDFHELQKERSWFHTKDDGSILGQKVSPVRRAGLYIPGGQGGNTPLISSLLMQVIPAQVAGVREIAIISPPREDGSLNAYILAAAYLLDISEVYCVGGPWGIGALAYGTQSILPVDVITGPGNIYVTTAKKIVQGHVGIDMLAGPSEILIIADDTANIDFIAADMLSQAEHDSLASAVCVTSSQYVADKLHDVLLRRVADLPRAAIAKKSLEDWGAIILVPNSQVAIDIANSFAPEHIEILTKDPWSYLPAIENAGAVFLGAWAPEPVGDYFAGPNHVLPTQGTARFSSALSVQTFCKKTSIIATSANFTRTNANAIARLARLEGLEGHALCVESRISNHEKG